MNTPYVRHNCLRRLAVRNYPRGFLAGPRRAGFISLSKGRLTDNTGAAEPIATEDDGAQKDRRAEALGWSSSAGGSVKSKATEGFLENLFSTTQQQSPVSPIMSRLSRNEGPETLNDPASSHSSHKVLNTLGNWLMPEGAPLEEQWAAFMHEYGSKDSSRDHSSSNPDHVGMKEEAVLQDPKKYRLYNLLLRIARVHSGRPSNGTEKLPTPTEAIRMYVQAGIMEDSLWVDVLWILLGAVMKSRIILLNTQWDGAPVDRQRIYGKCLVHVLEVWKLFVETFTPRRLGSPKGKSQDSSSDAASTHLDDLSQTTASLSDDVAWKGTLETPEHAAPDISLHIQLPRRFLSFRPQSQRNERIARISAAAVMTLDILCPQLHRNFCGSPFCYEVEFIHFMAKAVARKYMSFDTVQRRLTREKVSPEIIEQFRTSWETLPERVATVQPLVDQLHSIDASKPSVTLVERNSMPGPVIKSSFLVKAVKSGDCNAVDRLWDSTEFNAERGFRVDSLFPQFLWAYMCLRRPDHATQVLNTMVEIGHTPAQEHWHAMLRGCQRARDHVTMRHVWQKMRASGIRPGLPCWTIWIQGLVLSGQWQESLEVLEELSNVWAPTALPDIGARRDLEDDADDSLSGRHDLLAPSIIPINAAITSLLAVRKPDLVGTFLKWAELHKIQPDTATFNILLRGAVRGSQPGVARSILTNLESSGCQPDVHTFTIVLDGLFRNPGSAFRSEDSEAQVVAVSDIFRQMKDVGIEPSIYTYSSMLDGLLGSRVTTANWKHKRPNVEAARAVLDHMAKEGVKPSPHIYTILISHYFNSAPPDLASIDSLWNRMQLDGATRDHVFYDRMIEGYARVGDVEKMLAFLRRMPQEGKVPGWVALRAVLQSLVSAHEWDMVQDLVRDVGGKNGIFRNASRFMWAKKEFWYLVSDVRRRGIEFPVVEVDEEM